MKNFRTTPHRSTVAAESAARQIALSMTRGRVNGLAAGLVTGLVAGLGLLSPTLAQAVEGRHALIIGISHYAANVGADTLEGVPYDMKSARQIASRIAMLHQGRIIWTGPTADIDRAANEYVDQFVHGRADGPIQMQVRV